MPTYQFNVSDFLLRRIATIHQFNIEDLGNEMILFGIRGALPPQSDNASFDFSSYMTFKRQHILKAVKTDYYYPRCVIGQWLPAEQKVAIFPGSTVPNLGLVSANNTSRYGFNRLVPGFYDYKKGLHPLSGNPPFQQHRAIRMQGQAVVRRNVHRKVNGVSTISYAPADSHIEVTRPGDNIHAARNNPKRTRLRDLRNTPYSFSFVMTDYFSSYGCQVVVGNATQHLEGQANGTWNAWDQFQNSVYEEHAKDQQAFKYLLFTGREAYDIAQQNQGGRTSVVLRFGAKGETVTKVQQKLHGLIKSDTGQPYYPQTVDGDYGPNLAKAIIQYQKDRLGIANTTSFVDARTATSLGISDWLTV